MSLQGQGTCREPPIFRNSPGGFARIDGVAALMRVMRIPVTATAELLGCAGDGQRAPKAQVPPAAQGGVSE